MPITVTIHDITVKQRSTKLPDKCPKCKLSFRDGGNLRQFTKSDFSYTGNLKPKEGFIADESKWVDPMSDLILAYSCNGCGEELAVGEEG